MRLLGGERGILPTIGENIRLERKGQISSWVSQRIKNTEGGGGFLSKTPSVKGGKGSSLLISPTGYFSIESGE